MTQKEAEQKAAAQLGVSVGDCEFGYDTQTAYKKVRAYYNGQYSDYFIYI